MTATRWSRATVLWIGVLSAMASFQLWRGAFVDGVLFVGIVAVLVVDRLTGGRIVILRRAADAPRWGIFLIATVIGAALIIAPQNSAVAAFVLGIAGALALVLAWSPSGNRPDRPAPAYRRAVLVWSLLGVALCMWEAAAYIASVMEGGDDFPTISVLLNPALETFVGRTVFTALWIAGGLSLVNAWRKR